MKTKLRGVNGANSYHLRDNYFILVLYCRSFVSFVQWLFRRVYIAIQKILAGIFSGLVPVTATTANWVV